MAIRSITFHVGANSISPQTAQYAGVQGEHCAANILFEMDKELISDEYLYRVEFIDGMNTFDTTDTLTVSAANTVTVPLIGAWTKAGGAGEARLVISKLNAEQSEEMILYTLVGHVYFESKDGEVQENAAIRGLTSLIAGVKQAQASAYQASTQAGQVLSDMKSAAAAANAASKAANEATTQLLEKADCGAFSGHGLSVLGLYGTLAELQASHPAGKPGDAYAVGTAAANDLFVWNDSASAWQNIGNILGSWTMNDLCVDAGDWSSGVGGWMMDTLCMDAGDWTALNGKVSTLAEHQIDPKTHANLYVDGSII